MRERCREFLHRVASLFGRSHLEEDLEAELRAHLELSADRNLRPGLDPEQARRQALLDLGGLAQSKEAYREQSGLPMVETAVKDLRFGFRILRRNPGFSALVILCLTLGIGANATVFGWVEGILFRPYPAVVHQEQLLALTGTARGESGPTAVSWPDLLDFERNCRLIDSFMVTKIMRTTLSTGDRAEGAIGSIVSANYFDAIGVHPILGRGFEPGEDSGRNAHPVTVISYQMWRGRFRGDPLIIGKTQRLNNVVHTIVGVMPEGFYGTFVGWAMQFWVPASMEENFEAGGYKLEDRSARWIEAYVRLKPGVTRGQAQEEISVIAQRLEAQYPESNRGRGIRLWPLWQTPFNNAGTLLPTLEIMVVVVVFVLFIACANVGNLLLVRSFARRGEMTVRLAIGAGRGRLLQQLLVEGLLLSALGTAGGLGLAYWSRHALVLLLPARGGVAMHLSGEMDGRFLALSAGVCSLATLLIGLLPALEMTRLDLAGALKAGAAGVVGRGERSWVRSGLVVVQVALSFVLLVAAGLLVESLQKIRNSSPGFSTHGVLFTSIDLKSAGYDAQRAQTFQDELLRRAQALPGVESAAFARMTPLSYGSFSEAPIAVDGYKPPGDQLPTVQYNEVGPDYLLTMGIPLLSGREFTRADNQDGALVAVVNETMAAHYWSGKNPLGERLKVQGRSMRVVGVAKDSKYQSVREAAKPFFYVPWRQNFSVGGGLYLRTPLKPETMAAALGREVRALDGNLALYEVISLQEQLDRSTSAQKVAVTLLALLGALALLLAAIGLFGVMSYAVSQSSRELGLRKALGADSCELLRLVMARGLTLSGSGVLLGAGAALVLTRLLGNLLYQVSPRDPRAFGSALLVMTMASLAACFLPGWRAARTDPARVLRH
jgi:predicted permease